MTVFHRKVSIFNLKKSQSSLILNSKLTTILVILTVSTKGQILPTFASRVEDKKRFILFKKFSSFFRALWFCGIATTHEKMDESENAPTNENSSAHKDESSEFKFKLFHIEQVECDSK